MGWYGDYENIQDAINNAWMPSFRGDGAKYALIEKKVTRQTAAILYMEVATEEIRASLMIFRDNMYKPLSWVDRLDFIPAAWKKRLEPFMSDYERGYIQEDKEHKAEQKKKRQELDTMLEVGTAYRVYGGGELRCEAVYKYKRKNSHIFEVDGTFTRFTGLGRSDYWTLEKIA